MNLKQLAYFVQVAEVGSFSKAARLLGVAQPALSRQVRQLETDLRETLLLRNGRGVAPTDAGRRLLVHGNQILQAVAQAENEMGARRDEPVGRITVGLPPSIGRQLTLPLIDRFRQRLPQARLAIVEGLSSHVAEWISSGRLDIGLLYNPEPQDGLEFTPLLLEPLSLVSSAALTDERGRAVAFAELPRYPLVLPERGHTVRRVLEGQALLSGVKLDIAWEVSSVATIIDLVCASHGHAVLHASAVAASGRLDQLQVRPLQAPSLSTVLCLATSAHKRPSPLMRHMLPLLTDLVRSLPQAAAAQSRPG